MHAVMTLIALMLYGHTRAVGPTSSLTRGPPIDEDFKCTRWEVSPIWQRGVYACVAGIDTRSGYGLCEIVTKKKVERRKNRRCASQLKSLQAFHELSRHLGTPNKKKRKLTSCRYLFCGFRLVVRAPPPVTTHYHAHPSFGPPCVLLVLDRARGSIRHSAGLLSSSVKVRVVRQRPGASRRATKLLMLSLRSFPRFTFYPTLHLSTTRSPA